MTKIPKRNSITIVLAEKINFIFAGLQIPSFWAGASDVAEENTWKWVSDDTQVIIFKTYNLKQLKAPT